MAGDQKQTDKGQDGGGWQYRPTSSAAAVSVGAADEPAEPADTRKDVVEWTASEFVAHEKGAGWYAVLGIVSLVVAVGVYLGTKDIFSVVVVVLMAALLGVAGAHKPRVVTYKLDNSGLTAGKKFYPYRDYKSFSMPNDGPFASIVLVPMRRFGFSVGAFLAPDSQARALELLANHLPMERDQSTGLDQLLHQLRF